MTILDLSDEALAVLCAAAFLEAGKLGQETEFKGSRIQDLFWGTIELLERRMIRLYCDETREVMWFEPTDQSEWQTASPDLEALKLRIGPILRIIRQNSAV